MTAPVGEDAVTNFIRYENPDFDALSISCGHQRGRALSIVHQLQEIFYNDIPVVDIWYGAHWFEYRTEHCCGMAERRKPIRPEDRPDARSHQSRATG